MLREPSITQHDWNTYRVKPATAADKPRKEKQSFLQILKAQTSKGERVTLTIVGVHALGLVVVQVLIHIGVITGPGYL
ncbi:MAG: hypothetical protein GXY34_05180 [Syntrophomonadaceae bacterium]|nr:hypothetical protein [Syntrophomonadaceae bacterium]